MTLSELHKALNELYPTRYSHFSKIQKLPFICYIDVGSSDFHADNSSYVEGTMIDIELYTDKKDLEAEQKIKELLKSNKLTYTVSPTVFIKTEGFFQIVFSTTLTN